MEFFRRKYQNTKKLLYNILKFSFDNIPYYKNLNIDFGSFKEDTIFEDIKNMVMLYQSCT